MVALHRNQTVEVENKLIRVDPTHWIEPMINPCKVVCQLASGDWFVRDNRGLFRVIPELAIIPVAKQH